MGVFTTVARPQSKPYARGVLDGVDIGPEKPSSETAAPNLIGQERRASSVVSAVFRAFRSPCLLPRLLPHQRAACRLILTPPIPCCEYPPHEASCSSISCPTELQASTAFFSSVPRVSKLGHCALFDFPAHGLCLNGIWKGVDHEQLRALFIVTPPANDFHHRAISIEHRAKLWNCSRS